jgi:outer membrane protein insertion porin family
MVNEFDLSFTEPWLFDYPISFGFDAYRRQHKRDESVGYGYDEKVTGGDLRLGKVLTEYLRGDLMYKIEQIHITNITENATNDLTREYGKNNISSLTGSLTFDSRDNIFETRKGDVLGGTTQLAGGPLGGNKSFWKFTGRASHYFPLWRMSSLEIRGRLGIGSGYKHSEIPIYERYFVGGANTVRGYDERKLGPIDPNSKDPLGGDSMFIANLEYTYPLYSFLKLAAFFDSGNAWNKSSKIFSSGLKSGFGLGVRLKTPIGPMMLDYGIPINKAPGEEKRTGGKFHFSASHGF